LVIVITAGYLPMASTKRDLRAAASVRRGGLSAEHLATASRLLCEQALQRAELAVATVAVYVSAGTEPGTEALLAALYERGTRVLLPVVRPDLSLDWVRYEGPGALRRGRFGIREPTGLRLGPEALTQADVVLVPALLVDRDGNRLGRGGGSYDRALPLRRPGVLAIAVLHAGEVVDALPTEPHDATVDAAFCPDGFVVLGLR
jgi:5-formyltetrahydrofolate cyclo-ligase